MESAAAAELPGADLQHDQGHPIHPRRLPLGPQFGRTMAATALYRFRSPGVGATDSVRACLCVNCSPTVLLRLRTMTSRSNACSSSTFFGTSLSPGVVKLREVPLRAQQARLEKGNEVEQLVEIVLDRRRRQEQNELLPQLARKLPRRRRAVAQVVSLVDNYHVPPARMAERWGSRLAVCIDAITRSCAAHAPASVAEGRVVVAGELDPELAAHFPLPLGNQRRREQHEDRPRQSPHEQFRKNEARFDGLSQPHLVAEQGAPRSRRSTVVAVRVWCSRTSMSRTIGSEMSRSKPGCVASRAALQAELELPGARARRGTAQEAQVGRVELDAAVYAAVDRGGLCFGAAVRCPAAGRRPAPREPKAARRTVFEPDGTDAGVEQRLAPAGPATSIESPSDVGAVSTRGRPRLRPRRHPEVLLLNPAARRPVPKTRRRGRQIPPIGRQPAIRSRMQRRAHSWGVRPPCDPNGGSCWFEDIGGRGEGKSTRECRHPDRIDGAEQNERRQPGRLPSCESGRQDSNLRPRGPKPRALPN